MEAKERLGRIRILAPASGAIAAAPFLDLTGQISTDGERGLLGFAAAPDFATSGVFYVFVTNPLGDIEIRRYRTLAANRDLADPASGDVILSIGHRQFSNHNGDWIGFGPDGSSGSRSATAAARAIPTIAPRTCGRCSARSCASTFAATPFQAPPRLLQRLLRVVQPGRHLALQGRRRRADAAGCGI